MSGSQRAPSAYQMEQAMSVLMSARHRMLAEDPSLEGDEAMLADILGSDPETCDCMDILHRVLHASVHAKYMAEAADRHLDDIKARRDRYRNRVEALRSCAFAAMDALGLSRIELPTLTASVRTGQPSVLIGSEADIPPEFVRVTTEPDKAKIKAALLEGRVIDGAALSNGVGSVQIRTR